jgi:hypothetical protein
MMANLVAVLAGATAMAGIVAALFFLKFWRQTSDSFFLLFSAGFAIDAAGRFVLAVVQVSDIAEPVYFLPRLVMFGLIALAIIKKNASR